MTVVAEVLARAPLEDDVAASRLKLLGVRGLGCSTSLELQLAELSWMTMLVTGGFFGASSGLTLTSVFILLTTTGDVCEAAFVWWVMNTRGGSVWLEALAVVTSLLGSSGASVTGKARPTRVIAYLFSAVPTCCAWARMRAACSRFAEVPWLAAPRTGDEGAVDRGLPKLQENEEGGLS